MVIHKNLKVLQYAVFNDDLKNLDISKKMTINTINQYSYCIAEKDIQFQEALRASDVLLPDGIGIVFAAKWLLGKSLKKIAGADLHEFLLQQLNKQKGSCFYMGASEETLKKIKNKLELEYPNINVKTYSPPFKKQFSPSENHEIISAINSFKPNVLFVGMTAPKQEKWSLDHKEALQVNGPICAIGAVFDFYAGTVRRPSNFWQNLGLEWLGRLLKEPKRMWKRYIYYGAVFGGHLIKSKFKSISSS